MGVDCDKVRNNYKDKGEGDALIDMKEEGISCDNGLID